MSELIYIITTQQTVDQTSTPNDVDELLAVANNAGFTSRVLYIDPLSAGWNSPLATDHFRSGNSPLEAIEIACQQLRDGIVDIVVISGEDNLKTGYTSKMRREMMEIYPDLTLLEAYTQLAKTWCQLHKMSSDEFIELSKQLFDNYSKTYTELMPDDNLRHTIHIYAGTNNTNSNYVIPAKAGIHNITCSTPDDRWFEFVTDLFRGVDCANPVIDYVGKIMLATRTVAEKLISSGEQLVEVAGIGTRTLPLISGINDIPEIAKYNHLRQSFELACESANIDFIQLFKDNKAYLEVYTCFPVVPLAFLYATGMVANLEDTEEFISNYQLTVTGGMNLAKAPWNLPVLRAIIALYDKLQQSDKISVAGVHGNGGLGEKQGFMILKAQK